VPVDGVFSVNVVWWGVLRITKCEDCCSQRGTFGGYEARGWSSCFVCRVRMSGVYVRSGGAFFESQNAKIVALSAVRLVGLRLEGGLLVSCKGGCAV